MSAHVLTSWGNVIKHEAHRTFYHYFANKVNNFNNTRARMLDSI